MSDKFRWCFIGCGTLARVVAQQLNASGRHEIVSVYARRFEASRDFTDTFGGTPYETPEEAISTENVDGVYIVTPHRSHAEYSKLAINLGKPVLCEKPFTINLGETREVLDLAREKGVYITEAMWTWFSPVGKQIKKWLDDGELGDVLECTVDCRTNSCKYAPRVSDPAAGGGAVLDMGVYSLYYLYKLFGKPEKIECTGDVHDGIDWSEEVLFRYADGRTFRALSSIDDEGVTPTLDLKGSAASIHVTELHYAGSAEFTGSDGKLKKFEGDGSYLNEFDIVSAEMREGLKESRFITHSDTLAVMEMLDECRRQMNLKYDFED